MVEVVKEQPQTLQILSHLTKNGTQRTLKKGIKRWVKQAEMEFEVLSALHSRADLVSGHSYVCFIAHQVAEKALKGGVYALCGMDGRGLTDHNLTRHARALESSKPEKTHGLSQHCIPLKDHYLKTRYPCHWPGYTDTPSHHYTFQDAEEAKEHAMHGCAGDSEVHHATGLQLFKI